MYVVPRGVEHRPVARDECLHILLIEPIRARPNTGNPRTAAPRRLGPAVAVGQRALLASPVGRHDPRASPRSANRPPRGCASSGLALLTQRVVVDLELAVRAGALGHDRAARSTSAGSRGASASSRTRSIDLLDQLGHRLQRGRRRSRRARPRCPSAGPASVLLDQGAPVAAPALVGRPAAATAGAGALGRARRS